MKKTVLMSLSIVIAGCASMRYPNWEQVKIEKSVINKPCVLRGTLERCDQDVSECGEWFKKRATLVNANTTVFEVIGINAIGRYYSCDPIFQPYKVLKFTKDGYYRGSNTVTGQGFMTQVGGGVVTCAGKTVNLYPNTPYFVAKRDGTQEIEPSQEAEKMEHTVQCDAAGNFEFDEIPDGNWRIETSVYWNVPTLNNIGSYYYYRMSPQGGYFRQDVEVVSGKKNRFLISQ